MTKKVVVELEELERFLVYLNDKVDDVYKKETTRAVEDFIKNLQKNSLTKSNTIKN
ncbi:hypothetical protein [Anaerocellum danielii]|uniref:Core-binding (CB) domain-containing protein n=1 Tax=Anaerocellum danielii TaxID=1387557 RepID=A0ABZ0TYU3_9FIRM|nr:hypothetical protein [Caldicellulosiruptor danielii]WPX08236.1 hypothetical protein SOJ16_002103 [Caldicellulosiruptor danielii]